MYAALWRRLPGALAAKTLQAVVLVALVVTVLFLWVFPAVSVHLPFEDVTVTSTTGASP